MENSTAPTAATPRIGGLQTPSQTVGPYFAYGLAPEQYHYNFRSLTNNELVDPLETSEAITIVGKVFDGQGNVIPDAMVELWDANNQLFGRFGTGTDVEKRFIFKALKPVSVNGEAPYLSLILFMRGQLIHSYTRIYFSDETALNDKDEVLLAVPAERRNTLIAQKTGNYYTFNINMQGDNETVFFEI